MKKLILFLLLSFILLKCGWFRLAAPVSIRLKGSDTMLILASHWAETYMKLKPNVAIYVEGGGTEKGVEALIQGRADICLASRPLRAREIMTMAQKAGVIGIQFLVAKDGLSLYVHPSNPVQDIRLEDVKKIFRGEITNWSQVGGNDEPILVLIRPPNSGTHLYFKEHVLNGEAYGSCAQTIATTSRLVEAVIKNREAVGYGGSAYGAEVTHCKINGVEPTVENVQNDSYPIIRYLYLFTTNTPRGELKSFIDWILKDGQKIVREVGYIPLWEQH
ncbi:MAG TPA: phosphate ABC transporter substrate-binding protein [bacterium]|nr:phosphate ABC transporter substrate-binding protein [bacterium]